MSSGPHRSPPPGGSTIVDEPSAAPQAATRHRRRRAAVATAAAAAAAVAASVVAAVLVARSDGQDRTARVDPAPTAARVWMSGAAGVGVPSGEFGAWRGRPVEIAGTWADNNRAMTELPQLRPQGEYGSWNRSLDIAVGAIGRDETWAEAARGAYDARWRHTLETLRDLWGTRSGTVYIRFAHEMNGNWYPWAVDADDHKAFIAAWKRFRALQQEIFPASKLVFCVNRESVGNGIDWRRAFPGAEYVDVMGVDYYNQSPYVDSPEEWDTALTQTDSRGAPKGLEAHLDFARSVGLPLAIPEWSGNAEEGDSPAFIEGMYDFVRDHAGSGAGQVLYEIQFNVDQDEGRFLLYGDGSRMPESARAYRQLW